MAYPQRHLTTRHGTIDTLYTFTVCDVLSLAEDVPVSTAISPTTLLRVISVPKEIPDAKVLEFKANTESCAVTRFTTIGTTPIGSRTITIQPYVGQKVPCKRIANLGAKNLTGRVYRAQVKKKLNDAVPFLTLDCAIQPLAGTVSYICNSTTIPFSEDYFDPFDLKTPFPSTDAELQAIDAIDLETGNLLYPLYAKTIAASYFWDSEYTLNGVGPIPAHRGRFWLQKEATI
jgi:hypothetical protein